MKIITKSLWIPVSEELLIYACSHNIILGNLMVFDRASSSWNNVKCQIDATSNFIDLFLARHISGAYAHHQEH